MKLKTLLCLTNFLLTLLLHTPLITASTAKELDFKPESVVSWIPLASKSYEDGSVVVEIELITKENFGLYDSKLEFFNTKEAIFTKVIPPIANSILDPMTGKNTLVYQSGVFKLLYQNLFPEEKDFFEFELQFTGCSGKICLFPYKQKIQVSNYLLKGPLPEEEKKFFDSIQTQEEKEKKTETIENETPEKENSLFTFDKNSFDEKFSNTETLSSYLWFLLFLFFAGLATNLTPCIYPMIPITIKILSRQKASPLLASSLYALGIMLTYSTLALIAILSGSMFGHLMANPWTNTLLAFVMFYFGLSMLGYGDYSLLQKLGNKFFIKEPGLKTAFFMGLGAGLLASPCTGPILGSLLAYSATTNQDPSAVGHYFLVYSFGFSLPYVFLGKAASQLTKIQFRSSLQTLTKTVFSSIMFALFFYYLRIPFYDFYKNLDTSWGLLVFLSLALSLIMTFLSYFSKKQSFKILSTLALGFFFFSTINWTHSSNKKDEIPWITNEDEAFKKAHIEQKPIFIDMWAEWCEVCKKIEKETFAHPLVKERFKKGDWILLKLDLTKQNEENKSLLKKYDLLGLPSFVFLPERNLENKILHRGEISPKDLVETLDRYSKD